MLFSKYISMSLTLLYPVRRSPFTSLWSVTVGLGRVGVGLLGLLEPVDPEPGGAVEVVHVDHTSAEVQAVRGPAVLWVST